MAVAVAVAVAVAPVALLKLYERRKRERRDVQTAADTQTKPRRKVLQREIWWVIAAYVMMAAAFVAVLLVFTAVSIVRTILCGEFSRPSAFVSLAFVAEGRLSPLCCC
jgi:ABC-type Fe3+ transport system permease subunit